MIRAFLGCTSALVLLVTTAIAQSAPPPATLVPPIEAPATATPAKPAAAPKKKVAPSGPNIAGNWGGELTQVDNTAPYKFELAIGPKGAETKYPGLDCAGKLTRVGSSKSYVFFIEIVTKGRVDKGGRCPDGTITVARQGDDLALAWFGSVQGKTVVAYGTLSKK